MGAGSTGNAPEQSAKHWISAQRTSTVDGDDGAGGEREILDRRDHSGGNLVGRGKSLERRAFQLLIAPALVHRLYEISFDQAGRNRYDTDSRGERARQRFGHIV